MTSPAATSPAATKPAAATTRRAPRAFTMIELIVVSVLMVVLAAVIVPRLVGTEDRRARETAEAVRDLLSAAAEREAFTSAPVTLAFDGETSDGGTLSLLIAEPREGGKRMWREDPIARPVPLVGVELERSTVGGIVLSRRRWRAPLQEGEGRAGIELLLRRQGGRGAWLVSLPAAAVIAGMIETAGDAPALTGVVDLDEGRGRDQPW